MLEKWTDLNLPVKGKESKDWSSQKESGKRMWRGSGSQRKAGARLGEHQGIGCQLHTIPGPPTDISLGWDGKERDEGRDTLLGCNQMWIRIGHAKKWHSMSMRGWNVTLENGYGLLKRKKAMDIPWNVYGFICIAIYIYIVICSSRHYYGENTGGKEGRWEQADDWMKRKFAPLILKHLCWSNFYSLVYWQLPNN